MTALERINAQLEGNDNQALANKHFIALVNSSEAAIERLENEVSTLKQDIRSAKRAKRAAQSEFAANSAAPNFLAADAFENLLDSRMASNEVTKMHDATIERLEIALAKAEADLEFAQELQVELGLVAPATETAE